MTRADELNAEINFYPRPLRGGRPSGLVTVLSPLLFLSTPSARRATVNAYRENKRLMISIHALCEEGDHWPTSRSRPSTNFYPRPLRGGRRGGRRVPGGPQHISIHALCEEGDGGTHGKRYFPSGFLSTPSARRATWCAELRRGACDETFLSTPSARRATLRAAQWPYVRFDFYPRPLRGGRPDTTQHTARILEISIHALCEEGDVYGGAVCQAVQDFYPRPLRGGRRASYRNRPRPE